MIPNRLRPSASSLLVWFLLVVVISIGMYARRGYGTWPWLAGIRTDIVDGAPLEWEWIDVRQSVWFLQADPRWSDPNREEGGLLSQNASRTVPALATAWIGSWTRTARTAASVLTWLAWVAAVGATYWLARLVYADSARGGRVGLIAAALVAVAPGFSAFVGSIDTKTTGYAATAVALLATEWAARGGWMTGGTAAERTGTAVRFACFLFLAGATIELGPPLLAMLWGFYVVLDGSWLDGRWPDRLFLRRAQWAATTTLAYASLAGAWWLLVYVVTRGRIAAYNDATGLVTRALADVVERPADLLWIPARVGPTVILTHTAALLAFFALGLVVLPRRPRLWALTWAALIVAAGSVTKAHPREFFVAYPAVCIGAAGAADWLGSVVMRGIAGSGSLAWAPQPRFQGFASPAAGAARWLVPIGVWALIAWITFGDLRGDASLPAFWYSS